MPFFSAWIDKADRKMKQTYLWIWVISLFLPYMGEYISHYLYGTVGKTLLLSALLFAAGYSVTFTGFSAAAHNPAATESDMELFFTFCSPNVLCMTLAVFLALQKVVVSTPALIRSLANITKCGFGIYMVHYFPVGPAFLLIGNFNLPIPLQVPVMAILIFLCAWGFTALMYRLLGRKARWIMG